MLSKQLKNIYIFVNKVWRGQTYENVDFKSVLQYNIVMLIKYAL